MSDDLGAQEALSVKVAEVNEQDWEELSVEDALRHLNVDRHKGLFQPQVVRRLQLFGENGIKEQKKNPILQFFSYMNNPLSYVMMSAAVLAIGATYGCCPVGPPDWEDLVGILLLLFVNATIAFVEERNAANAVAALKRALAQKARCLRNGSWDVIDASQLVPGDVISLRLGDQVPADCKVLEGEELKVDQSSLTGESLPVSRRPGQILFSGSVLKQGECECLVTGTGVNTFFGKSFALVAQTAPSGHFQQVQNYVGYFCLSYIMCFIVFLIWIQWGLQHYNYRTGIENVIVLLIGGVPIALPVILSVILAVGAEKMSHHKAIVTRITAIEELAGMTVLCSDKTGTMTLNKLSIQRDEVLAYDPGTSVEDLLLTAARASRTTNLDAIDAVCIRAVAPDGTEEQGAKRSREGIQELHFFPFNPIDKKTIMTYRDLETGRMYRACKGFPPAVLALCNPDPAFEERVDADLDTIASRGFRGLGVAVCEVPTGSDPDASPAGLGGAKGAVNNETPPSGPWTFQGIISIFDPPRKDTAETIRRALALSVPVKMITGDALAIAKETARQLGMGDNIHSTKEIFKKEGMRDKTDKGEDVGDIVEEADGFAGVYPEHKYAIAAKLQERGHIVGMAGDGVNDAPALKKANIGIAVSGATDAARGAADLVLTEEGLSVMIEAVVESRRIFQRMLNYLMYAVASTVGVVTRFSIAVWAFEFNMPPFLLLVIVYLNDGTIMAISTDNVLPSPVPDKWNFFFIFCQGLAFGLWMALSTLLFIWSVNRTNMWVNWTDNYRANRLQQQYNGLESGVNDYQMHGMVYLQVSILAQSLIFSTRSRYLFFLQRPSLLLMLAFVVAQLVATFIAVYADWGFTRIRGCGWQWAVSIWIWDIIFFLFFDFIKIFIRCCFERSWRHAFFPPPTGGEAVIEEQRDEQTQEVVSMKVDEGTLTGRALSRAENTRRLSMQRASMAASAGPGRTSVALPVVAESPAGLPEGVEVPQDGHMGPQQNGAAQLGATVTAVPVSGSAFMPVQAVVLPSSGVSPSSSSSPRTPSSIGPSATPAVAPGRMMSGGSPVRASGRSRSTSPRLLEPPPAPLIEPTKPSLPRDRPSLQPIDEVDSIELSAPGSLTEQS